MKNIFIVGSMAYDEIMDFPHHFKDYFHPEKLHQINVSFVVSDLAKHLGGIATNISYALRNTMNFYGNVGVIPAKEGLHPQGGIQEKDNFLIYPVGAVGRDGGELLEFFKKNNIDITYVQKDEKLYTATGKVITDKDDNQIWGFYYGASAIVSPKFNPPTGGQSLKEHDEFWILSATHEKPFTTALHYVINNKLPYLFDPGMTLTWIADNLLRTGVLNAKYVVGNDYEIAMIEKRLKMAVKEIVAKGINVITTLGDKGVDYSCSADSALTHFPASALPQSGNPRVSGIPLESSHLLRKTYIKSYKVKKVVDPTGAGDAWRGGFVGALVAGKPLKECLVMGNVMASFAVENVGTVEYKTSTSEIQKRVKSISK